MNIRDMDAQAARDDDFRRDERSKPGRGVAPLQAMKRLVEAGNRAKWADWEGALRAIAHLQDWIRSEGERNDTCTYDVLGEVCSTCRCRRAT
jgi:hypothetical protein